MSDPSPNTPPAGPRSEAEILADPHLRGLLEDYHPLLHDHFLKNYARVLADLHRNGKQYETNLEYLLHQHDKEAAYYLWMIQHQKLFDLECQWRAGLVQVPGARLTADFEEWHEYIEECRVIPPISPDELALFDAFLAQLTDEDDLQLGNPSDMFWLQRLHPLPAEDDEESPLWEWTQFWDLHRGTANLRMLPDLRGEQEARYMQAAHAAHRDPNAAPPPPEDPRPHVPTYGPEFDEIVRDLLRRFEPAASLRQFETKHQLEAYDASEDRLDLPLALERLQNAGPVLVPIGAHTDWREAVIEAATRHYLDQIRAALPYVYEQYCQREELGISHAPPKERHVRERGRHFAWQEELVREGRRLLGEPDDLNF